MYYLVADKIFVVDIYLVALLLCSTPLADVVLLLRALTPVGLDGPSDGGEASVVMLLARLDRLQALGRVPVLVVTHVAL